MRMFVVEIKGDKIELSKEELQELLDKAYDEGFANGKNQSRIETEEE